MDSEAYKDARSQALQAYRRVGRAESYLDMQRQELKEALALVAAREPEPDVSEQPSIDKAKAPAWSHIRNEMVWIEDDPKCGFLSCSCGWWGWHPWAGSDLDHLGLQKHQILTTALKDWIEHIQLVTTGREEPAQL